jgi:hypothetical protein
MRPSGRTTVSDSTFSRIVPYRTAVVPEARVAAIPPKVASAPGSTEKDALIAEVLVELLVGDTSLHSSIEIADTNPQNLVHP